MVLGARRLALGVAEICPMLQLTDPLTVLDKLPQEQFLLVYETTGQEGPEEQQNLHEDFRHSFGRVLDRLAPLWGEPDYLGTWEDDDFPDWYDALLMACWSRPEGTAYLAYQWSGPEVPMLLALGLRARG